MKRLLDNHDLLCCRGFESDRVAKKSAEDARKTSAYGCASMATELSITDKKIWVSYLRILRVAAFVLELFLLFEPAFLFD